MIKLEKIKISIAVILGLVLAFGVNLVFAVPPGPNVEAPIYAGSETQTKQGELRVNRAIQKDQITYPGATNRIWELKSPEDGYAAWFKGLKTLTNLRGWDIIAYEYSRAMGDLKVEGHISAPNQNWEDTKHASQYRTPNTVVIYCPDGWYLFKLQVARDGVSSQGWCASPFKKAEILPWTDPFPG